MRLALALVLAAASWACHAADRSYAVLSLVGDRLMISQYQPETGSRTNRNAQSFVETKNDALDRMAVRTVRDALDKAEPGAKVDLLAANDPKLYAAANQAVEQDAGPRLVAALRPSLKGLAATHWIVVSKFRGETRARVMNGSVGSGQVEGLGFYLDRTMTMTNTETGESATGFMAPFAYLRFTLVDAASGEVLAQQNEFESMSVSKQSATHPWDSLSADEKVAYLERLIRRGAADAIPRLLKR